MDKWEYCTVGGGMGQVTVANKDGATVRKGEVLAIVNIFGEEGWEAFGYDAGDGYQTFALRRRKG